jgi:putative DNA primase/helicase
LQEWFGYCLLPDTSQQKILLMVGPRRSGKGTIACLLRALVGPQNTASPTLAGLGTNFGLWPLLGKTVAIISDARLSGRSDVAPITERLLSISGEDAQNIDRKNMSIVTTTLRVRFMILTNELPRLNDASGALAGRMVLLYMGTSWYGREDKALT